MPTRFFDDRSIMDFSRKLRLIPAAFLLIACSGEPEWRGQPLTPAREVSAMAFTDSLGHLVQLIPPKKHAAFVFFGYTNCPDVCPTTLADWVRVKRALGKLEDRVQFVFITIDPERDTPAVAQQYAAQFDPMFLGLSTSVAETDSLENEFGVASAKDTTSSAAGYLMGHSSQAFLMDDQGRVLVSYRFGAGWDVMVADAKALLK